MSAALIITLLLLVAASFVIIRSKRSKPNDSSKFDYFPPPPRGLFGEENGRALAGAQSKAEQDKCARRRVKMREMAARGDEEALVEAWLEGDPAFYREVLDALVAGLQSRPRQLLAVASMIVRSDAMRGSRTLSESLLKLFRADAASVSPTDLLRAAALSDDAGVYADAVEAIIRKYGEGRLPKRFSAGDLPELFEGEYWMLAPEARASGAGFLLKQKLADARRTLQTSGEGARRVPPSERPL